MSKRRVTYYYDPDVGAYSFGTTHAMKPQRMRIAHELIQAYDMLPKMTVLQPRRASAETMTRFHTDEYIEFLAKVTPENFRKLTFSGTRFLVGDDNPAFEGVFEFSSISAGGSIAAAQRLNDGEADIAINWAGGLHHAKKREASGFCYINDIVLGILELLRAVPRVLYIDIDCHHGDGVEEAFYTTDRVMTFSLHKFGEFFPGTGQQSDRGRGQGRGYAVNIPLKDGITDESYASVFVPVFDKILEVFRPDVIVLQCGADSLSGDKLGGLNLTMHGHARCVQHVRSKHVPLMLLGGGGYTVKNVARAWTYETACALGVEHDIDPNLPWNDFFEWFGPRYRLEVQESNLEDLNMKDGSLDRVRQTALEQLSQLSPAPSVQMQDVPREPLGSHLGFGGVHAHAPIDERDELLAQHARYVYNMHDSDQTDDELDEDDPTYEDEDDSSSDAGARRRGRSRRVGAATAARKRMSILTSRYFDVPRPPPMLERDDDDDPCGLGISAGTGRRKRRFFESAAQWDPVRRVVAERAGAGVRGGGYAFGVPFPFGGGGAEGLGIVNGFEANQSWVSVDSDVRGEDDDEVEMDEDDD